MTLPRGLYPYATAHDVIHLTETRATLRRCGAVGSIAMVEGITPSGAQRVPADTVRRYVDSERGDGRAVILCAFPDVRGDLIASRDALAHLCELTGCPPQLDAEPRPKLDACGLLVQDEHGKLVMVHWTPQQLAPFLALPDLSLTTTRIEVPHLAPHGLPYSLDVWGQGEQQTSTATLPDMLATFARYSPLERIHVVTGNFDQPGDPRTIEEVHVDLTRCAAQARVSGRHGVWCVRSMSPAECDAHRSWAGEIWG